MTNITFMLAEDGSGIICDIVTDHMADVIKYEVQDGGSIDVKQDAFFLQFIYRALESLNCENPVATYQDAKIHDMR